MPVCIKFSYLGNQGSNTLSYGRTVLTDEAGALDRNAPVFAQAGVLDAVSQVSNCQAVALTASEFAALGTVPGAVAVDGAVAAGFFSFGLTMVVGCYLVALKIGLVLDFVRRS